MDTGGTRFAIGLLILWLALLALFFALHPNGIANAKNPNDALQWLIGEFQTVTGLNTAGNIATPNTGAIAGDITGALGGQGEPNNLGASPAQTGA